MDFIEIGDLELITEKIVLDEIDTVIQNTVLGVYDEMKKQNLKSWCVYKKPNSVIEINLTKKDNGDVAQIYINNMIIYNLFIDLKNNYIILKDKDDFNKNLYRIPLIEDYTD